MNQIKKIKYNAKGDVREGYFIETMKGLVAVNIQQGEFQCIDEDNIISKEDVSINKITGKLK